MSVVKIRKVMIDAGHGGTDPGNVNWGLKEKDSTLALAERVGHYVRLYSDNATTGGPDIKTLFTRDDDRYVGIDVRAKMARDRGCDLMLSLHTDSSVNPLANGATVYVSAKPIHQTESIKLGKQILADIVALGLKRRGVLDYSHTHVGSLGVLRETCGRMPAVLVECGFASNLHDRRLLVSADGREKIAMAIARTVVAWFDL